MIESGSQNQRLWKRIPLYLQIIIALFLAVCVGVLFGAGKPSVENLETIHHLVIPCNLVMKALRALAIPLIFLAVINSFLSAQIPKSAGSRLAFLLLTNTLVAIFIGLVVANFFQPGRWDTLATRPQNIEISKPLEFWGFIQEIIPESIIRPFVDNNVLQLILIALAFGIALRKLKAEQIVEKKMDYLAIEQLISLLFDAVIRILQWVIALVPFAVFGIVANTIALQGFLPFKTLGAFVVSVLAALSLQVCYYLLRVKFGSCVNPSRLLIGGFDALLMAFSTASSTASMPVTYKTMREKVGLRESSVSLGVLVGSNFNNDGTVLYEAMSALFIAQVIGIDFSLSQQILVVLTSIFVSVGAAGIPEAGLVTMTLVFSAIGLPMQYIVLLITVDWFLDRCRTAINVMGDMTVSCLLDGKIPAEESVTIKE